MDEATYFQYESGKKIWYDELLVILSDYYKTSIDYLLGITDMRERMD